MKLETLIERRLETQREVKKSIMRHKAATSVAVFFDMDGVLFLSDAKWKILPDKVEELNNILPLTNPERATLKVSQERGAKFLEVIKKTFGHVDIKKYFDMSEFEKKEEFAKQVNSGKPIEATISILKKHLLNNHKIYILTARGGSQSDLSKTFGRELDKYANDTIFSRRGSVYTVNFSAFNNFWSELGIRSSADKKATVIQSYLNYKDGQEPEFNDDFVKEKFMLWRNGHELVDKVFFYDDEIANIEAVENMLEREKNKLVLGEDSVETHLITSNMQESIKNSEVEMRLAGISKDEVIKVLNEEDEAYSLVMANKLYDEGEILLKRKAIIELYNNVSKDNFDRKLSKKFKFEIVEMANILGLPQTNNREGLTEMIYEKIRELNEMARVGEYVKVDGKLLKITKGNRGRGTEVEAGGKKFKLKDNSPKSENGKTFFEVEKETTGEVKNVEPKGEKIDKRAKKGSVAIPNKYRPGAFVSAFTTALKSNKTTGVSEKGKEDTHEVEDASAFIKRFKDGLSKQENLKFKDALTKLADVADAIVKIYNGSASDADKSKLDSYVKGVKLKTGTEMSFSQYLSKLKSTGKTDLFHSKVKERLQKVIDKKTAAIEKSLGGGRADKVEEDLVYLNPDATRLLDKIEEASMYEGGIKMFMEGVIEKTPEEEKTALYENFKVAFKAMSFKNPAYEEILK